MIDKGISQVVLFLLTGLDCVSLWSPCMSFLMMHQISITPCPAMQRREMVDRGFTPNLYSEGTVCLIVHAPKSNSGLIGHPVFTLRDTREKLSRNCPFWMIVKGRRNAPFCLEESVHPTPSRNRVLN